MYQDKTNFNNVKTGATTASVKQHRMQLKKVQMQCMQSLLINTCFFCFVFALFCIVKHFQSKNALFSFFTYLDNFQSSLTSINQLTTNQMQNNSEIKKRMQLLYLENTPHSCFVFYRNIKSALYRLSPEFLEIGIHVPVQETDLFIDF